MKTIIMNKKDELIMALVHYFVTEEEYTPIVVKGVKDEIWLENIASNYKIIRINSSHIHNDEQLKFDLFKIRSIVKQIKKKTFSFTMNTLNIFLDIDDNVKLENVKNIDLVKVESIEDIKQHGEIKKIFPNITKKLLANKENMDFIINVTSDLNKKTEKANKVYEETFKTKKIIITNIIICVCVLMYFCMAILSKNFISIDSLILYLFGANNQLLVKKGEVFRLINSIFLHANLIHLILNMYSLKIIGSELETYLGKLKIAIIFLVSGISGSLLSAILNVGGSVGASGAIFGLLGSLLYFGYHYRIYLNNALRNQIIPIIVINLFFSFLVKGIDFYGHIGGLIGGFLCTMALGVKSKTKLNERINGIICTLIYLAFLIFILFFYK